jgi:hypothetical protein
LAPQPLEDASRIGPTVGAIDEIGDVERLGAYGHRAADLGGHDRRDGIEIHAVHLPPDLKGGVGAGLRSAHDRLR